MRPLVRWLVYRRERGGWNQISVSFPDNPELERLFRE
jgi:hypothetical protein